MLRSLDRMDAAFRLGSAAPAAGPRILIGRRAAGAGHASDRQKTRRDEWMRRHICKLVNRLDLLARNVRERIELQPGAVVLDDGNLGSKTALKTLAPVDPGAERRQRPRQRLHFADPAASIGIGEPQFTIGILA